MDCILCNTWNGTSYAARPTTPVEPREVEGLMTLGYWLGSRELRDKNGVPRPILCEKHFTILNTLDMKALNAPPPPPPAAATSTVQGAKVPPKAALPAQAQPVKPPSPPPPPASPAAPPPQVLVEAKDAAIPSVSPSPSPDTPPSAGPSPVQAMVNAAMGAPSAVVQQPTPQRFPCPACGAAVGQGEVHSC